SFYGCGRREGGLIRLSNSSAEILGDLDPERRRVGLVGVDHGNLLCAYYQCACDGNVRTGGVTCVDPTGLEHAVLTDLQKPIGITAIGGVIYLTDQEKQAVLRFGHPNLGAIDWLATVPQPDHLCVGPDETLLVATHLGQIYQVTKAGEVAL